MERLDFFKWFVQFERLPYVLILDTLSIHQNFESNYNCDNIRCIGASLCINIDSVPKCEINKEKDPTPQNPNPESLAEKEASERKEYNLDSFRTVYVGPLSMYIKVCDYETEYDVLIIGLSSNGCKYTYTDRIPWEFARPVYMKVNEQPSLITQSGSVITCYSIFEKEQKIKEFNIHAWTDGINLLSTSMGKFIRHEYAYDSFRFININSIIRYMDVVKNAGLTYDAIHAEQNTTYRPRNLNCYGNWEFEENYCIGNDNLLTTECLLNKYIMTNNRHKEREIYNSILHHVQCVQGFDKYCVLRITRYFRQLQIPHVFTQMVGKYIERCSDLHTEKG